MRMQKRPAPGEVRPLGLGAKSWEPRNSIPKETTFQDSPLDLQVRRLQSFHPLSDAVARVVARLAFAVAPR